jgi:hypothetical protein
MRFRIERVDAQLSINAVLAHKSSLEVWLASMSRSRLVRHCGHSTRAGSNPGIPPVHEAVQHVPNRLAAGDAICMTAMMEVCRDRAAEIATLPVQLAAALVREALAATIPA